MSDSSLKEGIKTSEQRVNFGFETIMQDDMKNTYKKLLVLNM
jgi:hypothetical protein